MRLYKSHTIQLAERCIIEAIRNNGLLSTTEITVSPEVTRQFHGVRTLRVSQVARICRRPVERGILEFRYYSFGKYCRTNYTLKVVRQ